MQKNLLLIGKNITGTYNNNKIYGTVVYETMNTIVVKIKEIQKKLLKNNLKIHDIQGKKIIINGNDIKLRPTDRIKLR